MDDDRVRSVLDMKGRDVYATTSTTTAFQAIASMNDRRIGSLVVIDHYELVGIITERDVLVRLIAAELDVKTTRVGHVMTRQPITASSNTTVAEAMRIMTDRRCRHLPICDDGQLQGLISIGDLTNWVVREQERRIRDLHDFIRAA
jgi:CBS domain-containing protein